MSERERVNCVVPRGDFAEAVKGYIYSLTLKKPFSTEYYNDIYVQAELTWSERRKVDAFIDKIDEFGITDEVRKYVGWERPRMQLKPGQYVWGGEIRGRNSERGIRWKIKFTS